MGPDKKKILVVDDELTLLRIMGIQLRVCGYEVVTASSGSEALRLIDTHQPDCVLLDIIIPDNDGLEVLRRLRIKSSLPVVAFSARLENAHNAIEMGADAFVAKPFDMESLLTTIKSAIENRSG
jgi:two-component system KDP operon response regulator KdpE